MTLSQGDLLGNHRRGRRAASTGLQLGCGRLCGVALCSRAVLNQGLGFPISCELLQSGTDSSARPEDCCGERFEARGD